MINHFQVISSSFLKLIQIMLRKSLNFLENLLPKNLKFGITLPNSFLYEQIPLYSKSLNCKSLNLKHFGHGTSCMFLLKESVMYSIKSILIQCI